MSKQINSGGQFHQSGRTQGEQRLAGNRHRRRVWQGVSLGLAAFLLASLVFAPAGTAQRRAAARRLSSSTAQKATAASARNAALTATTATVLKDISRIRELSILHQVRSSTQSRPEIQRMLIKSLDEESSPAELHATEIMWKKLGLAPADFHFREFLIQLLTEQVAGYYEPKSKQFHVADWLDLDVQKPVMAHELTHALQDQHFNLGRFERWPKGDSDAELAAHALVEGDASLAMMLYVIDDPLRSVALIKAMKAGSLGDSEQLDRAPRALHESLLFPYTEGLAWATSVYKQGHWAAVSRAFTELPRSSEQILHVEKYFAHEAPVKVELTNISNLLNTLGKPTASGKVWRRADYDIMGEHGYYVILDEFLKSSDESKRAAAGWGGDRYALFEGPNGEVLLAMLSTWDTERDAREFFEAYAKRTERRYPHAGGEEGTGAGNPPDSLNRSWRTGGESVVMSLSGSRVMILEGLPAQANAKTIVKALGE
ncbi:MAG: hypothetical protein QOD75_444 [Blastocatellia bacterium]|jgi:hypothetical protein|nr:hypothetical protein [Blastocatellia bacterium]